MVFGRSRAVGKHPMKQAASSSFPHRVQAWQAIESIKNALVPLGIDGRQTYQVTFDGNGNVTVHSSNQDRRDFQGRPSNPVPEPMLDRFSPIAIQDKNNNDIQPNSAHHSRPKVKRAIRVRGRSRNSSRHRAAPYPSPSKLKELNPSEAEEEIEPIRPQKKSITFCIGDTEQVVAFLAIRLKRMQQLADKKIAKAWIKGICPKKQAKFPYQNRKREDMYDQKPEIPGWWPENNKDTGCRFIEPDHIRREERMRLCLHLLRLRPSPEQLKAWNQDKNEPHPTHRIEGWTAFLEELAGPDIFDDLPKEDKKRTQQRQELLAQMYEVAKMEEEFQTGGIDADATYTYEEDEEDRRTLPAKRPHQSITMCTRESQSRSSSASASCNRAKRIRGGSETPVVAPSRPADNVEGEFDCKLDSTGSPLCGGAQFAFSQFSSSGAEDLTQQTSSLNQHRNSDPFMGQFEAPPMKRETTLPNHAQAQHMSWQPSGQWVDDSASHCYQTAPHPVPCYRMDSVPDPQFHSLPATPMYSPIELNHMQLGGYNCGTPQEPGYPTTMAPAQYFMPANFEHPVPEYHSASMAPQASQQLAERHMAPVPYNGLPFMPQGQWHDGLLTGHDRH